MINRQHNATNVYLLHGGSRTGWMAGTSAPIHAINEVESLELTDATAESYLRFFLCFLQADDGFFELTESAEEFPDVPGDSPEVMAKRADLREALLPLRGEGVEDERWIFRAPWPTRDGFMTRGSLWTRSVTSPWRTMNHSSRADLSSDGPAPIA